MEREPIDCMTCLVHPRYDNCMAVVEQMPGRVHGMRHVTACWQEACYSNVLGLMTSAYSVTVCGMRVPWPGTA